mgnify:CR=1 FL=1
MKTGKNITIEATINAPVEKVWKLWNDPNHIKQWNAASDDWHTPRSSVDLRVGGKFSSTMAAKDGTMSFDFAGVYTTVNKNQLIELTIEDGRKVRVEFSSENGKTKVVETFEAENTNPLEMQRGGWQAILDNFKKHVERLNQYEQLDFSIIITAPKKKVWDTMLGKETYKKWTSAAWPGSNYEGEWKEGETLFFFGPDKSGTKAKLVEHRPYVYTKAEHVASLDKGKEDTESEIAKIWIGSTESYAFSEKDGHTTLDVTMHVTSDWADMFKKDWPTALNKLKEICE